MSEPYAFLQRDQSHFVDGHMGLGRSLFRIMNPSDQLVAVRAMAQDGHSLRHIADCTGLHIGCIEDVLRAGMEAAA